MISLESESTPQVSANNDILLGEQTSNLDPLSSLGDINNTAVGDVGGDGVGQKQGA